MREYRALNLDITTEKGRAFLVAHIDEKRLPLIGYQVEMLLNNRVPGLLPLELRRNDRLLALYYHLEGFTGLAGYLQRDLDAIAFLDVLDSILQALSESQEYLLNLESFVLEEELIFIRPGTPEIGLVYIPAALKNDAATSLGELAVRIAGRLPDDNGEIKKGLIQAARDQDLTVSKMQKALNRLRIFTLQAEEMPFLQTAPDRDFQEFWGEKAPGAGRPPSTGQILTGLWRRVKARTCYWLERVGAGTSQPQYKNNAAYPESGTARKGLQQIDLLAGGEGAPFSHYEDNTSYSVFPSVREGVQFDPLAGIGDSRCWHFNNVSPHPETLSVKSGLRFNHLAMEADVCPPSDDLLPVNCSPDTFSRTGSVIPLETDQQNTWVHQQYRRYPVLKIRQSGREETVIVDRDDFRLGRSQALADYWTDNNRLLGRVHARIVRRGDSYHLIDLYSRNGTYLNGRRLEPACPALLRSGDLIHLANLEIRFES